MSSDAPHTVPGPEFIALQEAVAGRYSLVRELGRGGMGIVFLARDVALDRPVAIKLLPPSLAMLPEHRSRFVREARMAARLSHPHIVPIHSVEERGEIVFFAMAFIDGETLGARVAREGPLSTAEASRITQEVAWALGHAHAHGVVHRDVKPDNILIERGSGRALVTDFGIAHAADGSTTPAEGRVVGTPRFMSPEQAAGERIDGRSDIYSLGVVAYFAAIGRAPYDGATAAAVLVKHLNEPVPVVLTANPRLSPMFAATIERCMAKDPASRFATADELALSLQESETASARMPPPVRTFLREMEGAAAEIGTAVGAVATSTVLISIVRARHASDFGDAMSLTVALVLFTGAGAAMFGFGAIRFAQVIAQTRRLLQAGYGHSAVKPAIALELAAAAEQPKHSTSAWGMAIRGAATAAATWQAERSGSGWMPVVGAIAAITIPTLVIRQLWNNGHWWLRAMAGRFGALVFKVAALRLGARNAMPAAGEPTVIAIGHAASELYAALPEVARRRHPGLPALIERLESDALALRTQSGAPADEQRFAVAVAALESLRLDLLRLHAASSRAPGLTGDVDAAARIGDEIAAHVEAADAVHRLVEPT